MPPDLAEGRLQFDAATHRYTLAGRDLPSVTQVLASVGIIDYSHLPPDVRSMALERGRAVHEAIALDLEGDLDEESISEIAGYVQAARSARRELGVDVAIDGWEIRRYHGTFLYAGTIDLLAGDVVVDWKTNQAEYWVRFQLAAYAALVCGPLPPRRIERVCVELHDDGTYSHFRFPGLEWDQDFETFLAALRVHEEKTNRRPLR